MGIIEGEFKESDSSLLPLKEPTLGREILLPKERILRHILRMGEELPDLQRITVIPAQEEAPVFGTPFYLANIGSEDTPLILELRFEPISLTADKLVNGRVPFDSSDDRVRICLLMTNERFQSDLEAMGSEIYRRLKEQGIKFGGLIAADSLGPRLTQEIARTAREDTGREPLLLSFQKGKVRVNEQGALYVGPPKEWIDEEAGIEVSSGTSHPAARQKLFLDQKIARLVSEQEIKLVVVDDAKLTGGTIDSGIALLHKMNIPIAGIATVLNEGDPVSEIEDIPFVWLTKLPLMMRVKGGLQPIPGTYHGLDYFYQDV